ncbi:MAG: hypothetical protein ACPGWR_10815 [Ardenticatenaceae bacterium]
MYESTNPRQLTLVGVTYRCKKQTARFQNRLSSDPKFCYELWRRALEDRDEDAWNFVYAQYESLVISYIRRHPYYNNCYEEAPAFVPEIFVRIWQAIPPERFRKFPSLPSLLKFLQVTVYRLILNKCRAEPPLPPLISSPQIDRQKFWACIEQHAKSEQERIIVRERLREERKPAEIIQRHPQLFPNKKSVFRATEYLRARLRRDSSGKLKECLEDLLE